MAEKSLDRLTGQLYNLPEIVGSLGRNIADAQKQLNADYIRNIHSLVNIVDKTLGTESEEVTKAEKAKIILDMLESLAPSRYQYTETTLDFSADLAEAGEHAISIGGGISFSAVMVNASFLKGYAYDYRAAARVTTKIHAVPPGAQLSKKLIERSAQIDEGHKAKLPQPTDVDKELYNEVVKLYNNLTTSNVPEVE